MHYFCTYFDQHYLDKGLALFHSLVQHCTPFRLWILCMDEDTYRIFTEMQLSNVHPISLQDFEENDPLLKKAKENRSLIEYYFTCTPSLPLYVMDHVPEADVVTYLDADLYFFSSVEPVYQEMGDGSVLIIGHRFPAVLKYKEIYGIYNVGLVSFRRDVNGLSCLQWWRTRCLEWCYDRVENGRFADQKYLDEWPDRFPGVVVLQHKGAGLAPWNLANYAYSWGDGEFLVDGQSLIVYHFHGLKRFNRWIYDASVIADQTRLPEIVKQGLYIPYVKELNHANECLGKFLGKKTKKSQSIRHRPGSHVSLKRKVFSLWEMRKYPLIFFRKLNNNDIIFNKR